MLSRRIFLRQAAAVPASRLWSAAPLTPEAVHRELVQGNQRFVSGAARHPHSSLHWAKKTGREGQHPHAIVLSCSDSRVIPEILFDQGIGDLFTIRVAGNVANEDELASIEYAVHHFEVPLTLVLGHSRCGAITAVVEGEELPESLRHLTTPIRSAFAEEKKRQPGALREKLIEATIRVNVEKTAAQIAAQPAIRHLIEKGAHRVEGAVYDLDTGKVSWLRPPVAPA